MRGNVFVQLKVMRTLSKNDKECLKALNMRICQCSSESRDRFNLKFVILVTTHRPPLE